ncbi:MAG TPA: uracil phosphoribosyltransferase, partial [Nitrospiraceae bacterium]|nr:uracil phosphoribosyltransferase [Nitrospiraceae bacterium]
MEHSLIMPQVTTVNHPLAQHHLTRLRDVQTPPAEFRALVRRLAMLLACEATRELQLESAEVVTPLIATRGARLRQRIGLVPILRAGLGMVDPVLELLPEAEVWHLGLYRDEET